MGTVPLVESVLDLRNLSTISTYLLLASLSYVALTTYNRQQATVIAMVSPYYQSTLDCSYMLHFILENTADTVQKLHKIITLNE